jgi:hypothetical protein
MLRAREPNFDPGEYSWQRFEFSDAGLYDRAGVRYVTGAIKSTRNGRLVSTEFEYTGARAGMLRTRPTGPNTRGPWETFVIRWD